LQRFLGIAKNVDNHAFEILGNVSAALLIEEIGSIPNKQDGNAMRCFVLY
jgi:hypothetical protein